MTGLQLRSIRRRLGYNQARMAEALNTPFRTYQNWEQNICAAPACLTLAVQWVEKMAEGDARQTEIGGCDVIR